ncbi:uncharacterized protein LOC106164543 [Lingula anatina]|uniref:RBR-type E3 ubiquitin transferase n=1 Tax=Lingula anatina TaxID=7574 RepID=A0A1S3IJ79_LINAN|nr:uncharacterized protein LOC106164543 [Lingula anatina]|eukprot:XP_013397941.1 uncharacterized protein LOC106164543 [Lingula anatina]
MADTSCMKKVTNAVDSLPEGHLKYETSSADSSYDSFPFWHLSPDLFSSRLSVTENLDSDKDEIHPGSNNRKSEGNFAKSASNTSPRKKKRGKVRKSSRTKTQGFVNTVSEMNATVTDSTVTSSEQDGPPALGGLHRQLMEEIERFDSKTLTHPRGSFRTNPCGSFRRMGPFGCIIKVPHEPEGSISSTEAWDTDWDSDGWDNSPEDDDTLIPDLEAAAQQLQMLLAREDLAEEMGWGLRENHPAKPPFPLGPLQTTECMVCFDTRDLHLRHCCQLPVCNECLKEYFRTQVEQANVKLGCVNPSCDAYVHRDEIIFMLEPEMKDKFYRFLVDANKEPHVKTCPRCSKIMTLKKEDLTQSKSMKAGYSVTCSECHLVWCFPCQAPWHEGVTCKQFKKGDKLLRQWAKEYHYGQPNAKRCPSCKIFIQRTTGCDHMTCSGCKTEFCYRCGERFRELKFIGNHYNRLSIFGCKYKYLPEKPVQRRLIRGSIFGGKLLAAPLLAGLAIGAGGVLLGIGAIALPFYASYKLHKFISHKKMLKRQRRRQEEIKRRMQQMRDEYKRNVELRKRSLEPRAPIVSDFCWPILEIPVDINHLAAQSSEPPSVSNTGSNNVDDEEEESDFEFEDDDIVLSELLGLPMIDPNISKYFLKVGQARGKSQEKSEEQDASGPSSSSDGSHVPGEQAGENCNQVDLNSQEAAGPSNPGISNHHRNPIDVAITTEKDTALPPVQPVWQKFSFQERLEPNLAHPSVVGSTSIEEDKETGEVIFITKL